ncbi:TPA: hypothetical protein ACIFDU_002998 [Acinetobacter baumannii]
MTDLNKEREAFEKLSEIAEILNEEKSHFNGDFYDLPFNSCAESFINGAWYAWQEKAKAQAVPDTHVVVPKDVAERTIGHIGIAMCHPNNTHDDENIMNDDQQAICKAVEASESGAEG